MDTPGTIGPNDYLVIGYVMVAIYSVCHHYDLGLANPNTVREVWAWDSLINIADDVKMFQKFKFSLLDIVYILSRVTVFGFLTTSVYFQTPHPEFSDCHANGRAMLWLYALSIPPNSYLFVIRIRAVFRDSRVIQGAFVCVWLAVVAASLHQPFCARFSADCVLGTQVLGANASESSSVQEACHTSRHCYCAPVSNITLAILLTPLVPPAYRALTIIPNTVVFNIMACRVYREVKLGMIDDGSREPYSTRVTTPSVPSTMQFAPPPSIVITHLNPTKMRTQYGKFPTTIPV
ncbi:hypothetical protein NLI96_g3641 [Meripilus lineatus]|uniref:Uncharacterized protein n=1 Tax=Meripilus lineatus TaxID=2056292 RepID=A0AAD5YGE9_9APHY|nr:hypothetical protein NLI96_g3641 [Physisporinus lineatus]